MNLIWILLLLCVQAIGQTVIPENAPDQRDKPYVLLISFDGFRYDYLERYNAPNLRAFAAEGVRARAMRPSYRTSTFPNHYSIVTGLYPAHHGIVDNAFYDPGFYDPHRGEFYSMSNKATGGNGEWYGGTPLWVLAEQQGMRAASFFWPGSDTEIRKTRPSAYYPYDGSIPNEQRVKQVIEWFRLPKERRPHFVTMYFSDTDDDGHKYGPESQEARHAVERLDQMFGNLRKGLAETEVPVNIFVVGDHGMMPIREQAVLGTREEFPGFVVSPTSGAQVMLYARDKSLVEPAYRKLRAKMAADKTATGKTRWVVYKKAELPEYLHYRDSGRIGDLVVMARTRVALTLPVAGAALPKYSAGEHGYNVKWFPEMRTIFYAQGPNLKQHQTIGEFDNVNVYPLIAELLGLKPPANLDGNSKVLQGILKR